MGMLTFTNFNTDRIVVVNLASMLGGAGTGDMARVLTSSLDAGLLVGTLLIGHTAQRWFAFYFRFTDHAGRTLAHILVPGCHTLCMLTTAHRTTILGQNGS